jgi:hypothetical protein
MQTQTWSKTRAINQHQFLIFMKKTLTLAAALVASAAFAQNVVSISPSIATGADTITITLDANVACTGGKPSVMTAPEVRIHSGVAINNGNNWQNVVDWNSPTQNTLLTADTNNAGFYTITIVPNTFYGVTSGMITQLCMVFNGGSWDYEAKAFDAAGTGCADIFIPLFGLGVNEIASVKSVYPNPTSGELNIEVLSKKATLVNFRVVNLLGQSVMSFERAVEAGVNTLNADLNVANGTYFVEVVVDGMKSVKRVVVSH